MIELTGSEKQVAWATKIRLREMSAMTWNLKNAPVLIATKMKMKIEAVENELTAKWWIENQNIAEHIKDSAWHKIY